MSVAATTPTSVTPVAHYHVVESRMTDPADAGLCVTDDAAMALDMLAHALGDWSERNRDDEDATYAAGVAEIYCDCPGRGHSPEHGDAMARLGRGWGICETVDDQEFTVRVCHDRDCLKYCPVDDCRTVVSMADPDPWCWVCGASYVAWDRCPWLD